MRHRTGTYFPCFDLLLEIFHRDILPEVAVHINHDGIDTLHGIEDSTQVIIVGNLSGVLFSFQAKLFCNELITESFPVVCRIGYVVCIVVTGCTTKLSSDRTSLQCSQLTVQTIHEHHHFLTQTSRRSRLTVSLCQHRDVRPFFRIRVELSNQLFNQRIVNLFQCFLDRKRNRRIVDIL